MFVESQVEDWKTDFDDSETVGKLTDDRVHVSVHGFSQPFTVRRDSDHTVRICHANLWRLASSFSTATVAAQATGPDSPTQSSASGGESVAVEIIDQVVARVRELRLWPAFDQRFNQDESASHF
jgi:hypothetical protein